MARPRLRIIITTYDRPQTFKRLADQIFSYSDRYDLDVWVYDDNSPTEYVDDRCTWIRAQANHGKKFYWMLVNKAFTDALESDFDFAIMLPDDVTLADNFFERAIALWEAIDDENKICLTPLLIEAQRGKTNFTGIPPRLKDTSMGQVYLTQWTDLCFVATKAFFEAVGNILSIDAERWQKNPLAGSGVGSQISHRLVNGGYNLYQTTQTLVFHGDGDSKMNPRARIHAPLTTNRLRLGVCTTMWKRYGLTEAVFKYWSGLRLPDVELILRVAGSEDMDSRRIALACGWGYTEYPNQPLSDKFNAAMSLFRDEDVDAVMVIGSDDIICERYISHVADLIRSGEKFISPEGYFVLDGDGIIQIKKGIRAGAGMVLSREVLESFDYMPWESGVNKGTDWAMAKNIQERFRTLGHIIVNPGDQGMFILDIKSGQNIRPLQELQEMAGKSNIWLVLESPYDWLRRNFSYLNPEIIQQCRDLNTPLYQA